MTSFLDTFIKQVTENRKHYQPVFHTPPLNRKDQRIHYNLEWKEPSKENLALKPEGDLTLEQAREAIDTKLWDYYESNNDSALLVRTYPGVGKSTAAIKLAQEIARQGKRVLYLMPRHAYWDDIISNSACDPELWYHWRPVHGTDDNDDPMCRYSTYSSVWMGKGYPLYKACTALCKHDGHIHKCPYRGQAKTEQRIIAGVHNHAITGMSINTFDIVIIDELPLSAFLAHKTIKRKDLDTGGHRQVTQLARELYKLSKTGDTYRGKALLDRIGYLLMQIYDNIELERGSWLPVIPEIKGPNDVYAARYFYIFDLLLLLLPEFVAWQKGMDTWLSRVYIDWQGAHMLMKHSPWQNLPDKLILLDATGRSHIYKLLFNREIEVFNPIIKRQGSYYQIVQRLNGVSQILDKEDNLTDQGNQLLLLSKAIARFKKYNHVAIVTFKRAVPYFSEVFGEERVMYFGGSRGSNQLQIDGIWPDCMIIAGTPSPPDNDIFNAASQLLFNPDKPELTRLKPFSVIQSDGRIFPVRTSQQREYNYIENGKAPYRQQGGFWRHDDLTAIHEQFREAELEQAMGRGRAYVQPCDVWLLSSVPIHDRMDGIYHTPNQVLDMPPLNWGRWLTLKENMGEFTSYEKVAEVANISSEWSKRWGKVLHNWKPKEYQVSKGGIHYERGS